MPKRRKWEDHWAFAKEDPFDLHLYMAHCPRCQQVIVCEFYKAYTKCRNGCDLHLVADYPIVAHGYKGQKMPFHYTLCDTDTHEVVERPEKVKA